MIRTKGINMKGMQQVAQRLVNAENRFLDAVQEQFGKSEAEAAHILAVFKQLKVVKLDAVTGQFTLQHGAYWDAQVMDNALKEKV